MGEPGRLDTRWVGVETLVDGEFMPAQRKPVRLTGGAQVGDNRRAIAEASGDDGPVCVAQHSGQPHAGAACATPQFGQSHSAVPSGAALFVTRL
ncbi:hypothetical protein Vau01_125330 [Virgisporangium aurantiacum]|uniref:Uncharacterized protein n=1 Tax=Virgisporangium aurantiacum TaxID=175570 RepID=A0A8J3ZL99_9ACTN|nr:hypothetical protein Vau01_125330 [Virgisporangium aurantiacum]